MSADTASTSSSSNMRTRLLTTLLGAPVVLAPIFFGGWLLAVVATALAAIGIAEFCALGDKKGIHGNAWVGGAVAVALVLAFQLGLPWLYPTALIVGVALAFVVERITAPADAPHMQRAFTTIAGIAYIGVPLSLTVPIRSWEPGQVWLLGVIFLAMATDSWAYLGGRFFGKTPFVPRLSPKKTWEGAIIGVLAGGFFPLLVFVAGGVMQWSLVPLLFLGPLAAILGDLAESAIKRAFGVKDSHLPRFNIVPGHGGMLDRLDSLAAVLPVSYLYLVLTGIPFL